MKTKRLEISIAICAAAVSVAFVGCNKRLTIDDFNQNRLLPEDFFDFSTSENITVDLDYGNVGGKALIEFYDFDPVTADEVKGESVKTEEEPFLKYFTNASGKVKATIPFPNSAMNGVYLYSDRISLPKSVLVYPENGQLVYKAPVKRGLGTKAGATKAVSNPTADNLGNNFYRIVRWSDAYGKAVDYNEIISDGDLSSTDIATIQKAVWNGNTSKPSSLDNREYAVKSTSQINTTVARAFKDGDVVKTVDHAEVYFTFVQESGWNQNVVGYYFYPSDQVPSSPSEVKKYIILPNCSIAGNAPYGAIGNNNKNYGSDNAPCQSNTKIQLLYEDSNGHFTPDFPPAVTIGYFIIGDGFTVGSATKSGLNSEVFRSEEKGYYDLDVTLKGETTVKVGETITITPTVKGNTSTVSYSWSSSNAKVAKVSGTNTVSGQVGTVTGVSEGTVTITLKATQGNPWNMITYKSGTATIKINVVKGSGSGSDDDDDPSGDDPSGAGTIDFTKPIYYSNVEWNTRARCMMRNTEHYKIYGFEDNSNDGDYSFEDVLFTISSTPEGAVLNDEDPVEPPEDDETTTVSNFATYLYEDLWPNQGDYDMNDIAVEHSSRRTIDTDNYVRKAVDVFTVCNDYYSAGLRSAFAVVIPPSQRGTMTLPEGGYDETSTNSVIIFKNQFESIGKSFTLIREFDEGAMHIDDLKTDIDPYIIPCDSTSVETSYLDSLRAEVHMPKKEGTSKINPMLYGSGVEAYFVFMDGKHPFAISIPTSVTKGEFILPQEMYSIDKEYSQFPLWVSSNGEEYKDWYKYYDGVKTQ